MIPRFPEFIENIDFAILDWIQENMTNPILDAAFKFITALGNEGILWIAIAVFLLFFKKTRKTGIMMGVALLLGLILGNGILKNVIGRMRPYTVEGALVNMPIIGPQSEFSFPSGHTLGSFEAATVLFIRDKRMGIPALIMAALIAFSRVYLYVHFPTDIIGGIILAVINAYLGIFIVNKVHKMIIEIKVMKNSK